MATAGLGTSNLMGPFALAIFSQAFTISFPPNNAKQIWEKSANNNLIPTLHLQAGSLLRAARAELAPQVPLQLHPQQPSSRGLGGGSDPELRAETRRINHQILPMLLLIFHLIQKLCCRNGQTSTLIHQACSASQGATQIYPQAARGRTDTQN